MVLIQRGYGIGGLFRGLATSIVPLLTKVRKFVADSFRSSSPQVGWYTYIKVSKKWATTAGKKMVLNAISNSTRITATLKRHTIRHPSHAKRTRSSDAFGTFWTLIVH